MEAFARICQKLTMTEIQFANKHLGRFEVPDKNLIGVFSGISFDYEALTDQEISYRFANPIGTMPIKEIVRGKKRVLIVTDDNTRPTPLRRLLPFVFNELSRAGIEEEQITILIGLGTHRPMNDYEILEKFGPEISKKYKILNHAWNDDKQLVSLCTLDNGLEVVINRLALESDFIISMGNIIPHATVGFSGGGKTIMPGICGEITIASTHWKALEFSMQDILGALLNPVRLSVKDVCRKVGLDFIVDTVMADETLVDVAVGDLEAAHESGVTKSREIYGVKVKEKADIVVAEAFPTEIDLRQAIKAICSADIVLRDGGVILLAAECPEGISPQFPDFENFGFSRPEWLFKEVEEGRFANKLLAYTLVAIGRIISGRGCCILISPNIDKGQSESMGFIYAKDLAAGMKLAFEIAGSGSRVAVLRQAGELLPIMDE
jgi:nickel-dependent lactate racemase